MWLWIIWSVIHKLAYTLSGGTIVVQTHRGGQGTLQNHYIRHHIWSLFTGDTSKQAFNVKYELDDSGKPKKLINPLPLVIENKLLGMNRVEIVFDNGYWSNNMRHRENVDYHISVSLCGGIDSNATSGTFIIPGRFTELNVERDPYEYRTSDTTQPKNWLFDNFAKITLDFEVCAKVCGYETIIGSPQPMLPRYGTIAHIDRLLSPTEDQKVLLL
jgi:hypothetical protein